MHYMIKQPTQKSTRLSAWVLFASAVYGLIASFALTQDRLELFKDPSAIPACTINPIISCSAAMTSAQAEIFGIPNSIFGIAIYSVLLATSVFILYRTKFTKVIWYYMLVAAVLGAMFMHYLLIDSIFFLRIICPWCFGIWLSTPLIFMSVVRLFASTEHRESSPKALRAATGFIERNSTLILVSWYTVLAILLVVTFHEFLASLFV